jgi:hypothetical protein
MGFKLGSARKGSSSRLNAQANVALIVSSAIQPPPALGSALGGGYFVGQISTTGSGIADYNLVIAPKSSGQSGSQLVYKNALTATAGATSQVDGAANTADIVADGNSTVYPAAHYCNDLVIGGFSDWYLPAFNELEICYYNMKPDTNSNNTSYGTNPNSIPARESNYTAGNPARTTLTDWQFNQYPGPVGAECFVYNGSFYWASTKGTSNANASAQRFQTGTQYANTYKTNGGYVRGMRKVAV